MVEQLSPERRGLLNMIIASVLFAAMAGFVNAALILEPKLSSLVASFIRILVNLAILIGMALQAGSLRGLIGDLRPSLWLRGLFGSLSLVSSFAAIKAIGMGESAFLHASNGVFVAALSPIFLKQRNSVKAWIAILGSIVGLFLLYQPRLDDSHPWGRTLAVASGFLAALAYLMIAFAGRTNKPSTVVFYFCGVGVLVHLIGFSFTDVAWPESRVTYTYLLIAGICASAAQVYLTRSYQSGIATSNASVSYLLPVLNLIVSVLVFGNAPDSLGWYGVAIILVCGVLLPFVKWRPRLGSAA